MTVVGRNPTARIKALASTLPSFRVTGVVPDVRPYLEEASVFIVPMRVGGGTRLKIFEAMAMERAVVSTTVGAEGLPVEHERHVLLADTADTFAAAVVRLCRSTQEASELGRRAAEFVRETYGWDSVTAQFVDLCSSVVDRAGVSAVGPAT